jgi:hypothetical protein
MPLYTSIRVPVTINDGTFITTSESAALLASIGGGDTIRRITARFYTKAFQDSIVAPFVENNREPHGDRLGNWIIEKWGGEGDVWTSSRPPDSRSR